MLKTSPSQTLNIFLDRNEEPRNYIGASAIGNECERAIWYQYNAKKPAKFSEKQKLIFETGHVLEDMIKKQLIARGMDILTDNFAFCDEDIADFRGHCDGVIIGDDGKKYILEIKTAKNSSFNLFKKNGLRMWSVNYFTQIQAYMGMSGIHEAYIFVINKDNCEHLDEFVTFDELFYRKIREKALRILKAKIPPTRINGSPIFYKCKMCSFSEQCHEVEF